ncbi:hypothetical protein [Actinoplanes sp. ATCC 53533]|uniref:hypothetical protein n=1 Tax=Actinoplanes sp. ATCC 53533 TaxID=1288362 RepID=UPI000F7B3BBE|nr:hypothetical protein [Actinoplanes sp. ATCC 53533]
MRLEDFRNWQFADSFLCPFATRRTSGCATSDLVDTVEGVTAGWQIFLRRTLQQCGSVMGHGGYLGPDYTAEYPRNSAEHIKVELTVSGQQ